MVDMYFNILVFHTLNTFLAVGLAIELQPIVEDIATVLLL